MTIKESIKSILKTYSNPNGNINEALFNSIAESIIGITPTLGIGIKEKIEQVDKILAVLQKTENGRNEKIRANDLKIARSILSGHWTDIYDEEKK